MKNSIYNKLVQFLKEELAMSAESLEIAKKASEQHFGPIPMILWQYGLISLEQLDRIFDWLARFGHSTEVKPSTPSSESVKLVSNQSVNLSSTSLVV